MSKVICEREDIVAIADSVRAKIGVTKSMTLGEIKTEVDNISVGAGGEDKISLLFEANGNSATFLFYIFKGTDIAPVLHGVDFSKVQNMNSMFSNSSNLITVPYIFRMLSECMSGR